MLIGTQTNGPPDSLITCRCSLKLRKLEIKIGMCIDANLYSQGPIQHPLCFGKTPAKSVALITCLNLCDEEGDLDLCVHVEVPSYLRFGQLFSTQYLLGTILVNVFFTRKLASSFIRGTQMALLSKIDCESFHAP